MKNVVIYARFSSDKQTEQSIEGQLRVCYDYAKKNNYNVINEYIDRSLTGTNDNRPAFQQMIEKSKEKQFEIVLVYKLDRFSRSRHDSAVYKALLRKNNVKVISATELITNTPEGIILEGMLESIAEFYSAELSQKTKRGMRESLIKGNSIGGHILYGYKVVNKKICIDEATAPAIQYFFQEYANGKNKKDIVNELNSKGYRTNKGKQFTVNNFQDNLKNKKYIGIFDNGDIVNENYYPQLIDKEIFEKVQIRLQSNKHKAGKFKAKEEYLLTGKVFCGYCENYLTGTCGTSHSGDRYHYYICNSRLKNKNCKKNNEKKIKLENDIINTIIQVFSKDSNINEFAESIKMDYNQRITLNEIQNYEERIHKINKDIDKLFNVFWRTDSIEIQKKTETTIKEFEQQKIELQRELEKIKILQQSNINKQDIIDYVKKFLNGDINDINYKKRLIDNLVNSIFVFDDEIIINLTTSKQSVKLTLQEFKNTSVRIPYRMGSQIKFP